MGYYFSYLKICGKSLLTADLLQIYGIYFLKQTKSSKKVEKSQKKLYFPLFCTSIQRKKSNFASQTFNRNN